MSSRFRSWLSSICRELRLPSLRSGGMRSLPVRFRRAMMGLIVLGFPVQGCGDREPSGIGREQFVDAYIRLVRARIDAEGDSTAYAARRDRALSDLGVTVGDLRGFLEARRERPEELRDAWQAIAARLDTLYGGVTSAAPPELRRTLAPVPKADSAPGKD